MKVSVCICFCIMKANYTHPQTGLRYASAAEFRIIEGLSEHAVQKYLGLVLFMEILKIAIRQAHFQFK